MFQSFIVAVPEGARALLLKAGRYDRTVGAGRHVVPPWIIVSHVVTVREIPFDALTTGVPTQDDVRVDIDLLLTFTIGAPEKFVFAISAPDFDQVCLAAALEAIRDLVRSKRSDEILDVSTADTDRLRTAIGEALAGYGVEIERVVITHVQPPVEFMASRESRRLAAVRRDEQTDKFALEERLLADREALERQRIAAQREQIELRGGQRVAPPPAHGGPTQGVPECVAAGRRWISGSPWLERSPGTPGRWSRSDPEATSRTRSSSTP